MVICPFTECDKKFSSKKDLKEHKRKDHSH